MPAPRPDDERIDLAPAIVFILFLVVPFLNFQLTFYRTTLKLFVFQTATVAVWAYVLWQWASGRLRTTELPAWWLFAPLALGVGWTVATVLWSARPWLAGHGIVQGATGLLGAAALAVMLRERGLRRSFIVGASAVAAVIALLMVVYFGSPESKFFGESGIPGNQVGGAFLLLPTLAAGAMLYELGGRRDIGKDRLFLKIIGLAFLLGLLLVAGWRSSSVGWAYGLAAGAVVLVWLLVPRLWPQFAVLARLAVVALAVACAARVVTRELEISREAQVSVALPMAERYTALVNLARLDRADWALVSGQPLVRMLLGSGCGAFQVGYDRARPVETYAISMADRTIGHARRALPEMLYERGLVGLALALAAGLACVVAGALAVRRARDPADGALGAGLAAGIVATGVCAILSPGPLSFGASMVTWLGVGLLGALSVHTARPVVLVSSQEEGVARREHSTASALPRGTVALAIAALLAVAWVRVGLVGLWTGHALRDGRAELEEAAELRVRRERADYTLEQLAAYRTFNAKALAKSPKRTQELDDEAAAAQAARDEASEKFDVSIARAFASLRRASQWTLDGRVWANAEISLVRSELVNREPEAALERHARIEARCGDSFALDLVAAKCHEALGQLAEAHERYRRYAVRNPLAAECALFRTNTNLYHRWLALLERARLQRKPDPRWRDWGVDLLDACARGLEIYPDHYGLLTASGDMLYRLGRDDESHDQLLAAESVVRFYVGRYPLGTWNRCALLLDLAKTAYYWQEQTVISAVTNVLVQNVDWTLPAFEGFARQALALRDQFDPGTGRQARAEAARARRNADARRPAFTTPGSPRPATAAPPASASPASATRP